MTTRWRDSTGTSWVAIKETDVTFCLDYYDDAFHQNTRYWRQLRALVWATRAFGPDQCDLSQRAVRALEEMIEAYQAAGGDIVMAHRLIDFIFSRPPGSLGKELGQVGLTLLLFAQAAGVSADETEAAELARVLALPADYFAKRNAAKNAAGFDTTKGIDQ